MPMKIEKMNNGFFKLGDDDYRVEAPFKYPNSYRMEDFIDVQGKPQQRYVITKMGKKLRSGTQMKDAKGNFTEVEPKIWHLYKMKHFERPDKNGVMQPKTTLEILNDDFHGTAKEAIAACEAHKAGV